MLDAPVQRGIQNTGGKTCVKEIWKSVGLKEEVLLDRIKWKNDIHNHSGDPR